MRRMVIVTVTGATYRWSGDNNQIGALQLPQRNLSQMGDSSAVIPGTAKCGARGYVLRPGREV